jgi:hypothetical protein
LTIHQILKISVLYKNFQQKIISKIFLKKLLLLITSDAQRSSVWRSVAKASAERTDFAER